MDNTINIAIRIAYDSIYRNSLINIVKEFKFHQKRVNLISISIMDNLVKIKIGNIRSHPVAVKPGLRQDDVM